MFLLGFWCLLAIWWVDCCFCALWLSCVLRGGGLLRCAYRLVVWCDCVILFGVCLVTACLFYLLVSGLLLFDCLVTRAGLGVVLVVYSWCLLDMFAGLAAFVFDVAGCVTLVSGL